MAHEFTKTKKSLSHLNPALKTQGKPVLEIAESLKQNCLKQGGVARIPKSIKTELLSVARILNIHWIERGAENKADLICPKSEACPRQPCCYDLK